MYKGLHIQEITIDTLNTWAVSYFTFRMPQFVELVRREAYRQYRSKGIAGARVCTDILTFQDVLESTKYIGVPTMHDALHMVHLHFRDDKPEGYSLRDNPHLTSKSMYYVPIVTLMRYIGIDLESYAWHFDTKKYVYQQ